MEYGNVGILELPRVHPETLFSPPPRRGRVRVGVMKVKNFKACHPHPPHPNPLPQGEREFPDGHYLRTNQTHYSIIPLFHRSSIFSIIPIFHYSKPDWQ